MTQFAGTITQGNIETILAPEGRIVEIKTTGEAEVTVGPFQRLRVTPDRPARIASDGKHHVKAKAVTGSFNYSISGSDIVPFTGNRTLTPDDDGKLLRCDDSSNVVVTVPATLPECFSCGFVMWGAGTVTATAGSGATNRSAKTALSTEYQWGSVFVAKNADNASAEFVLGGDFS